MNLKNNRKSKVIVIFLCVIQLLACRNSYIPEKSGDILFGDDFSVLNKDWMVWNKPEESAVSFLDNGLIIIVYKPDIDVITTNKNIHDNVSIHTLVKKRFGTSDNVFGVVCRYLNNDNYYGFLISSDGYYGIVKVVNGIYTLLSSENMEYDNSINKEKDENLLQAICQDTTLTIIVNGEEKKRVIDTDLKKGKTGLIAGSFSDPGETAVFFDNFLVTVP
jgi:hypothetical protein